MHCAIYSTTTPEGPVPATHDTNPLSSMGRKSREMNVVLKEFLMLRSA